MRLFTMVRLGDLESKDLLDEDINVKDDGENSLMMYAAYYGHPNIVEMLIGRDKRTIWDRSKIGNSSLMMTCSKNIPCVKLLLETKWLVTSRSQYSALYYAAMDDFKKGVQLLLSTSLIKNSCGYTAYDRASVEIKLTFDLYWKKTKAVQPILPLTLISL